jgi:hypothetical protein
MPLRSVVGMLLLLVCAVIASLLPACGYNGCADIPVLESISPTSANAGDPSFTLTLTGRHFHSDTIFFFGSTELTSTTVNETEITAKIDAKYISSPSTIEVFVSGIPGGSNLNGPCGGGPSNKLPFIVR